MIPLLIVLLLLFSFFDEKFSSVQKTLVLIFCLVMWWFLESFRWESGTDFYNYYNNFDGLRINHVSTDRFELGYNLLVLFCRDYLKCTFYVFNALYYSVIFLLYFFSIRKATPNSILFLFIFFCFAIGLMGSTRQLMAVSIMFFASVYFLENKKVAFIACILLASLFHRTIIVCLIFVVFNHNIRYKYWLCMIAAALLIQISGVNAFIMGKFISLLPESYSDRFTAYLSLSEPDTIDPRTYFFGILRRGLPVFLLLVNKDKLNKLVDHTRLQYILNIMFFSLFAYIILSFNFTFIISRISIYFNIFEALFYVWLITIYTRERKYLYIAGLVSFFLVLCVKYIMNYPQLFLPYKTIFFTF